MCLGIPGQVLEFVADHEDLARVDVSGVRRVINIGLLSEEHLEPGDWILIHVGFALSKIDETEAQAALQFLEDIGDAYAEELMALQSSAILDEAILDEAILDEAEPEQGVPDAVRG